MKLLYNGEEMQFGGGASGGIPTGGIIIWSGAANAVPDGWALCDGNNGTPDLRDRFVLGAGTKHAVGSTGGSEMVTLTKEQMPLHDHLYSNGYFQVFGAGTGTNKTVLSTAGTRLDDVYTNTAGNSAAHNNMPPYYTLAYIMKL